MGMGMGMGGGAGAMAGVGCACAGACGAAAGVSGGLVSGAAGEVAGGTAAAVSGCVAGGTLTGLAALGGVITGPFLAVGGMVLAARAKKVRADAATNFERVNVAVEHIKNMQTATEAIFYRSYTSRGHHLRFIEHLEFQCQQCLEC